MKPYYEDPRGITIYHGDCRLVLDSLARAKPAASLLLADPPYGMTYDNKKKGLRGDAQRQGIRLLRQMAFAADKCLARNAHVYLFCHWESWPDFYDTAGCYWNTKNALIWNKGASGTGDLEGDYAHDYEMVLYAQRGRRALAGGRDSSVLSGTYPIHGTKRRHPTEKPVGIMRRLLSKSTAPGDLVLDPFMGVGPVLRAAKSMGRRAIGIEIDEGYCETAAKDLEQEPLIIDKQVSVEPPEQLEL